MTPTNATQRRRAELAGSSGAGVLGLGLGAVLAQWIGAYAGPLLVAGAFLHGWGMWEKRRLEKGETLPAWALVLYWLCWLFLAALLIWIGLTAIQG